VGEAAQAAADSLAPGPRAASTSSAAVRAAASADRSPAGGESPSAWRSLTSTASRLRGSARPPQTRPGKAQARSAASRPWEAYPRKASMGPESSQASHSASVIAPRPPRPRSGILPGGPVEAGGADAVGGLDVEAAGRNSWGTRSPPPRSTFLHQVQTRRK